VLLMDVNETRLHLLLGREDWERAITSPVDPGVCFDERRHTVGLRPRPFVFPTRAESRRLRADDRRGVAADRFGNLFWVGPDRRTIQVVGAGQDAAFTWWPELRPDPPPSGPDFEVCRPLTFEGVELVGLAITEDQFLVVGVPQLPLGDGSSSAGLLVFDLSGGGPPVPLAWPAEVGVRPFDLTATAGGGVVVLDVTDPEAAGPARLWQLDRNMQLVDLSDEARAAVPPPTFGPVGDSSLDPPAPAPAGAGRTVPLSRATRAVAVELFTGWATAVDSLPDGSVVVLDRQGSDGQFEVSRWRCLKRLPFKLRLDEPEDSRPSFVCTDQRSNAHQILAGAVGHDFVVVRPASGGPELARLLVVDDRGDQAFEFVVDETGADLVTDYHPLSLFGGKGLAVAAGVPYYDLGERWYPVPIRPVRRFDTSAVLLLAPEDSGAPGFDSRVPGTVWHRLVLDAVIPPGTAIEVESRANDNPLALERQVWRREPSPYLRGDGSEIPYHSFTDRGPCAGQGSWELLFQSAVGRFLQLRLTLRGDGRQSPRIWAARIHFPRFSYLREYLPDIYREDRDSAAFLDRYLANVEGMYTTLEGRIVAVERLVDPTTLDVNYLPWLASWVGAAVELDWEPARIRLFVRYAARLFTRRGTSRGLIEAIRLATHPCPSDAIFAAGYSGDPFDVRIVEAFRTRSVPGVVFGNPLDLAGPRLTTAGARWDLPDGGSLLIQRWRDFLQARYDGDSATSLSEAVAQVWGTTSSAIGDPPSFPVLTPSGGAAARDWHDFVRGELTPTYADVGSAADHVAFGDFLAQRYRRFDDYRRAWGLAESAAPADFGAVPFPAALPADGAPLQDWFMFVSAVLPTRRSAHRATVLVPIQLDDSDEERARRLGRVRRVVEVERPAHTVVDVQPFWAALRVGEARVGLETIVGQGGRYVDLVLGRGRLAQTQIPGGETWRGEDRVVVGRDRIERSVTTPIGTGGMR
jgi:phage tail-like protein